MWFWPSLQLTEYEKKFVGYYKSESVDPTTGQVVTKPGVLGREYQIQLANQAQPARNIPQATMTQSVQIGRRARVYAITFSGNTDCFQLSLSNTNGKQYILPTPRGQSYPVVSSLIAGSYYNALALGGPTSPLTFDSPGNVGPGIGVNPGFSNQFMSGMQSFPWLIEPNYVLQPNETLIFKGFDISPQWIFGEADALTLPTVLNITVYAWEFPGMGKGN